MRSAAVKKILDRRDYLRDRHSEAYARGDRAAWMACNWEIETLALAFERITGIVWWFREIGFNQRNEK